MEVLNAKIAQFKLYIRTRVIEFIEAHPTLRNAWEYVKGESNSAVWVKAKKRLITAAKGLVMAGFVGKYAWLEATSRQTFITQTHTCTNKPKYTHSITFLKEPVRQLT